MSGSLLSARVIAVNRDERGCQPHDATQGHDVRFHKASVADESEADALFAIVRDGYGRLDVLVNKASITLEGPVATTCHDDWRNVLSVNLDSAFLASRAAIPLMIDSGSGGIVSTFSIVSTSSICGHIAMAGGVSSTWLEVRQKTSGRSRASYGLNGGRRPRTRFL